MELKQMCKTLYSLLLGYTSALSYFISVDCVSVIIESSTKTPIEVSIKTADESTFVRAKEDIEKFVNDRLDSGLIPACLLIDGVDIRVVKSDK